MLNDTGTEGQVGRHGDMVDVVNGPEGGVLDWRLVDWRQAEDDVRRLRQRIFAASRAGDLAKARNLQKLMLRSRANTLVSVRRVTEIKAGGKTRALGIPVIVDRALQAQVLNALEPEWEARFEPRSYGFRPGRSCQDAIAAIFWTVAGTRTKRRWALDADLSAAFDRVGHDHILRQLGTFPARGRVR